MEIIIGQIMDNIKIIGKNLFYIKIFKLYRK